MLRQLREKGRVNLRKNRTLSPGPNSQRQMLHISPAPAAATLESIVCVRPNFAICSMVSPSCKAMHMGVPAAGPFATLWPGTVVGRKQRQWTESSDPLAHRLKACESAAYELLGRLVRMKLTVVTVQRPASRSNCRHHGQRHERENDRHGKHQHRECRHHIGAAIVSEITGGTAGVRAVVSSSRPGGFQNAGIASEIIGRHYF